MTPKTWYTSVEPRQETQDCERLAKQFVHTFEFVDEHPTIKAALQTVKGKIVDEIPLKEANSDQCNATIQQYSLTRNLVDDPTNISRPESEGT